MEAALKIMKNEVDCLDPRLVQESQHLLPHVCNSLELAYAEAVAQSSNVNVPIVCEAEPRLSNSKIKLLFQKLWKNLLKNKIRK
jgi:hypothetical protein